MMRSDTRVNGQEHSSRLDLEFLEGLEDELDLELARTALADPANATPIPWDEVKQRLGL